MNQDWEKICRRCGQCCYEKVEFEGEIYYTDDPCEYLDLETRLCRVYPDRCAVRKGCVALTPKLVLQGLLPDECPYVKYILSQIEKGHRIPD
ncbi:MAG: hypothetical protein AB7D06_07555 [Pedobacter sp.]